MIPRRLILTSRALSDVFFRCHNKLFLLNDAPVKDFLLLLWARYKRKYGIRIFDFIVMDNHAHMLVRAENAEGLGNFMRTVNSQLARFINEFYDRDSQAIKERYKSPLITSERYVIKVMEYIWLNRYVVNKKKPEEDRYCSASWRLNPEVIKRITNDINDREKLSQLLDPYEAAGVFPHKGNTTKFVRDLLNAGKSKITVLDKEFFEHAHTIGDKLAVNFREEYLKAYARTGRVFEGWAS
jgi:REP element-mobilizing transposase RayT